MDRIHRLRDRCPEVALSTDIIVGFPGETDDEFETTLEILEKMEYDEIFAFKYSPRPQTVAVKIHSDDVPEETKKSRLQTVQVLQKEISLRKNRQLIGRVEKILLEGESKLNTDQMMGRTRTNKVVNVEAPKGLVGKTLEVRITGASANSLIGELH
jgi:tRNA-2-methylthio-N6-dimethylallyladenosine synthase